MVSFKHPSPTRKATVILRNFPRDIRDFFKAYAAKRGTSMKQLIVDFMSDCISADSQPKKKKGKKNRGDS